MRTVEIGTFLNERKDRFKPTEANTLGLKRIEKIDFSGRFHIVDNKHTKTNMILAKKGDLVISGINVEKGALGVYEGDEDVLATIHYSSYEYDVKQIDIVYLKWFLKSRTFQNIVKEQVGGGIKTELKPKRFLPLKIKLPELDDQLKIVKKINSVAQEINELRIINDQNEKLLKKLQQVILQEEINKSNSNYTILKELIVDNPRNGYSEKGVEYPTKTKCLTLTATTSGKFKHQYFKYIAKEISKDSFLWLRPGDILIQRSNSIEHVGVTAIFDYKTQDYIYPDLMMKFRPKNNVDTKYLHYVLLSKNVREYFRKHAKGTSGSMKKINQKIVNNTPIPLVSLSEQKNIVSKVDKLMKLCDELEAQLNHSKKDSEMLMQAVLHEAFEN